MLNPKEMKRYIVELEAEVCALKEQLRATMPEGSTELPPIEGVGSRAPVCNLVMFGLEPGEPSGSFLWKVCLPFGGLTIFIEAEEVDLLTRHIIQEQVKARALAKLPPI